MEVTSTTRRLRDLLQDFHAGSIALPQFQRDYVWKSPKIRNLLDSLFRGFPVGGFYIWQPVTGSLDVKRKAGQGAPAISGPFEGYLIDGQQRLTSLESAYGLFEVEDRDGQPLQCYLDLIADESRKRRDSVLFVTPGGNRTIAFRVERGDPTLVSLPDLIDGIEDGLKERLRRSLSDGGFDAHQIDEGIRRLEAASKMLDHLVPYTTVRRIPDDMAVEIFGRLNKGGVALRQGDVRAAELARTHAVDVLKQIRAYVSTELPTRLGFGFSFAFRALVAFHRGTAQFSSLGPEWVKNPGPDGRNLEQSWVAAERAITRALRFIDQDVGWSRRVLVPSLNALIVLAAAMDRGGDELDSQDTEIYRRWLCLVALRGAFRGSVESTINRYLKALREKKRQRASQVLLDTLKQSEKARVRWQELNVYAPAWGPITQVLFAYFVSNSAQDWYSGDPISKLARTDVARAPVGDLTVHHIFPRKMLADAGYEAAYANCPSNYALVCRGTNASMGNDPPDDVLRDLALDQRQRAKTQFFGGDAGDNLRADRYEEFCEWRAKRLAESLNEFLGLTA